MQPRIRTVKIAVVGAGFAGLSTARVLREFGHQILPHGVPDLTFAGYNSSLFSPLSAEMSAVWIASHLAGLHQVPPVQERRRMVAERLTWMDKRTNGHHARGTNIIPFSMHNIDEVLGELGLNIGKGTRARQWLLPVNPKSYRKVTNELKKRYQQANPTRVTLSPVRSYSR